MQEEERTMGSWSQSMVFLASQGTWTERKVAGFVHSDTQPKCQKLTKTKWEANTSCKDATAGVDGLIPSVLTSHS